MQTDLVRSTVAGADLTAPVPTCPGGNLGQLLRHLGGAHRWVETIARTRAAQPPSDAPFRDLTGCTDEDPAVLDAWLAEGAARLAATLRAAGPDAPVWTPVPGEDPMFLARRMAHETLVHRADAAAAVGTEFTADAEVALDASTSGRSSARCRRSSRYIRSTASCSAPAARCTSTPPTPGRRRRSGCRPHRRHHLWRRAHGRAAVAVRGPPTGLLLLLLVVYRRRPARGGGIEILGDGPLLDFRLERVGFG